MEQLPWVPAQIVWEVLHPRDLAAVVRTSRSLCYSAESVLYRLHAIGRWHSAVVWAAEAAHASRPETQAKAARTLDKVKMFCRLAPDALDSCYDMSWSHIIPHSVLYQVVEPPGAIRPPISLAVLFAPESPPRLTPPWAALHLAAWKGLDTLVRWLLEAGASVDASGSGTVTPLCLAVSNDKVSTAALLLAHGASSSTLVEGDDNSPSVLHLACVMGHTKLVEQLLATERVRADPADALHFYTRHGKKDAPAVVELLARHGAVPDSSSAALLGELFSTCRGQSAIALLRSMRHRGQVSPKLAQDILKEICSPVRRLGILKDPPVADQMIRELLGLGAKPSAGYVFWALSNPNFRVLSAVLPAFLDAGMKLPAKRHLLGDVSAYDKYQLQDENDQLAVVGLLLRHGATIGGATRTDALDPLGLNGDGREIWAKKLCGVLLDHCRQIPRSQRGKDIKAFLGRASSRKRLLEESGFDIDFI